MKRDLCRYCRKPMANEADCEAFQPGEGEHLCWHILQNCDQDAEQGIDLRDAEIARLERELEQERQDRKQADLDTIRALGERNDERKLADRLAGELRWRVEAGGYGAEQGKQALAAWKGARNETR